jgi:hypothetical protein
MADAANLNDVVAGTDEEEPVIASPWSQIFAIALKNLESSVPDSRRHHAFIRSIRLLQYPVS